MAPSPEASRPPLVFTERANLIGAGFFALSGVLFFVLAFLVVSADGPASLAAFFGVAGGVLLAGGAWVLTQVSSLTVDAGGLSLRRGRREQFLTWDQVRGRLAVKTIEGRMNGLKVSVRAIPVVELDGGVLELLPASALSYDAREAVARVEDRIEEMQSFDPGSPATPGPLAAAARAQDGGLARPARLELTEPEAHARTATWVLLTPLVLGAGGIVMSIGFLVDRGADAFGHGFAALLIPLSVVAAALSLVALARRRGPQVTMVDSLGIAVRRGWRSETISWAEARGNLEAVVRQMRQGSEKAGWEADLYVNAGDRRVLLAGASVMDTTQEGAQRLADERIALIASYDPAGQDPSVPAFPGVD